MTDEKPRVIIIPPKPELQQTTAVTKQLRVAAYCRVSTKEEEQASSYEAQCEYYTDKIMSNKEWTMAGIFADEGITGNSHFMFQELNNDVIAEHIENWIKANVK